MSRHRHRHHHKHHRNTPRIKPLTIIIILLVILGVYGGMKTNEPGYNCDVGIENTFCILWHETEMHRAMREMDENFNEFMKEWNG